MIAAESLSVEEALNKPVEEMITTQSDAAVSAPSNLTSPSPPVLNHQNGIDDSSQTSKEGEDGEEGWSVGEVEGGELSIKSLQDELVRAREERDSFESQYRGLLAKLSQMRSTLGDRLRQDAEELDRREQQIETLQTKSEEAQDLVETLKSELLSSHGDVERLSQELDSVRTLQSSSSQTEKKNSEVKLRELQEMTERYRIEAEHWESSCMEERAYREELGLEIGEIKRERDEAVMKEAAERNRAEREAQSAFGLQLVLEEFQASQESEVQRALGDYQQKYDRVAASLDEHKERTKIAEAQAGEFKQGWERCQTLEKDVKEKNILIGKLRHETVILNEHLTEALRRLRANTSDSTVDGRLITNLLIQFLNTPRTDTKRFEMLSLIGSVLNWTIDERERAGLQRNSANGSGGKAGGTGRREGHGRSGASVGGGNGSAAGEESFSNLFVEFLLSEAEKRPSVSSMPGSPTGSATTSGPGSPVAKLKSRPSFNLGSLASLSRSGSSGDVRSPPAPLPSTPIRSPNGHGGIN
ncbi:hypothetical protein CBS101457_006438 [Exobasidium rhododendri]|nr:hypothetical protein CBS101457_006438 [Exobasidium rhododendri]